MKKIAVLVLTITLLFTLTGCKKNEIIDYKDLDRLDLETCEDDCITDEDELKESLHAMLEKLDKEFEEEGFLIEKCKGEVIERSCLEEKDGLQYHTYTELREDIVFLIDADYELENGVLTTVKHVPDNPLISFAEISSYSVFMNDTVLKYEVENMHTDVYIIEYKNDFKYESYSYDEDEVNTRYSYEYLIDGFVYSVTLKMEANEVEYMQIQMGTKDSFIHKSLDSESDLQSNGNFEQANYYVFSSREISSFYSVGNSRGFSINHYISEEDFIIGLDGIENKSYTVHIPILLFDNWTELRQDTWQFPEMVIESQYTLYNGEERVEELLDLEFYFSYGGNIGLLGFKLDDDEIEDFIDKVDDELNSNGDEGLRTLYNNLVAFEQNPDKYLQNENYIFELDEDYLMEFFEIEIEE